MSSIVPRCFTHSLSTILAIITAIFAILKLRSSLFTKTPSDHTSRSAARYIPYNLSKMLPLLSALSLARRVRNSKANKNDSRPKTPMSKTNRLRIFAVFPVLIVAIALLLSILCVYAGYKPGYMEDYAVFTLNTSRIGENVLQNLDNKISSIHLKRSEPVAYSPVPTITPAPTTMVTMLARADIASGISSLSAKAGSKISSAASDVHSKATSIESAVASAATSAVGAAETNIINAVNKAYHGVISDLNLKDFYSVHISSTCVGTYVFKNGTNVTVGDSGLPAKGTHEHVDSCAAHSAIDPLQLIRILYWVGIVLTGTALLLGFVGLVRPTRKIALFNVLGTMPAFLVLGLASAVTHGVSAGAAHLINFIGSDVGIAGYTGYKFLQLTWASVVLLLVSMSCWGLIFFFAGRGEQMSQSKGLGWSRNRPDRTSGIALEHVSRPEVVHDRYGVQMI